MAISWTVDIYFDRNRDGSSDDLEATTYNGKKAYKKTFEVDEFEHGSSGSVALYYADEEAEQNLMKRSHSIKDPGILGVDSTRHGEPDIPDPEDIDEEEWDSAHQ